MSNRNLLIVYHTQSGTTRRLVAAAVAGARAEAGVEVRVRRAFEADSDDLLWSDGLLLATPENFGRLSGGIKDFFDRTFYAVESLSRNWPYALLISAGNDGRNAVTELDRIANGYPFKLIAEPVIVRGELVSSALERSTTLGQTLAAGLAMGIF